jgi:hypothetical protein
MDSIKQPKKKKKKKEYMYKKKIIVVLKKSWLRNRSSPEKFCRQIGEKKVCSSQLRFISIYANFCRHDSPHLNKHLNEKNDKSIFSNMLSNNKRQEQEPQYMYCDVISLRYVDA